MVLQTIHGAAVASQYMVLQQRHNTWCCSGDKIHAIAAATQYMVLQTIHGVAAATQYIVMQQRHNTWCCSSDTSVPLLTIEIDMSSTGFGEREGKLHSMIMPTLAELRPPLYMVGVGMNFHVYAAVLGRGMASHQEAIAGQPTKD